jgi:putative addiction module component (TIGR02574 family)
MATVKELYEEAMKLTPEERTELSDRLFQSCLPEMPGEDISPEEWERVWGEEIERRSDELHEGKVQGIDAFEAIEMSRRKLYEDRKKRSHEV